MTRHSILFLRATTTVAVALVLTSCAGSSTAQIGESPTTSRSVEQFCAVVEADLTTYQRETALLADSSSEAIAALDSEVDAHYAFWTDLEAVAPSAIRDSVAALQEAWRERSGYDKSSAVKEEITTGSLSVVSSYIADECGVGAVTGTDDAAAPPPPTGGEALSGSLTVLEQQYAGYTLTYEANVSPLGAANLTVTDAVQLGSSDVANSTSWDLTLVNTTPGDRTFEKTRNGLVIRLRAIYPSASIMCRDRPVLGGGCIRGSGELSLEALGVATSGMSNPAFALQPGQPASASGEFGLGHGFEIDSVSTPDAELAATEAEFIAPSGWALIFDEFMGGVGGFQETLCGIPSGNSSPYVSSVVAQTGSVSVCG